LKEARESNYWLKLILETNSFADKVKTGIEELKDESLEITNVIGAIIVSAKNDK
jgi:hypothetical protein